MRDVKISVRELVEYSLRSGSIDFEYQSRAARAAEGVVLHQRLQKKREREATLGGWQYQKEVSFTRIFDTDGLQITVRGRADGILIKDSRVFIEEIKTTEAPVGEIEKRGSSETHIAQAKCYAYFYMLENNIDVICVLLTYYSTTSNVTKEYEYELGRDELTRFFEDMLNSYAEWAKFIISLKEARNESIQALGFPYGDYRKLQREMCVSVYRAIERERSVFISAPTGTGKTISALFPAVKTLEARGYDKIFYLTAKTITRQTALDAAVLMEQKGLCARTLVLTAKDKICFLEKAACAPESCDAANGHFSRVNEALHNILRDQTVITREILLEYARTHNVCPYEFSLDIALFADIIICDYNYAFDPRVYLRRFFAETSEKYVFLVDEAHNLVDRAREMYSAEVGASGIRALSRRLGKKADSLKRMLTDLVDALSELSENIGEGDFGLTLDSPPKSITNYIYDFRNAADKWLAENRGIKSAYYEDLRDLYFEFSHFISILEIFDEKFVCFVDAEAARRPDGARRARLKLFCADPSGRLSLMLKNAASSAFFSATLTPLSYFKRILGASDDDYAITFPSPFPKDNLKVLATSGISAKYKDREQYYESISENIYAAVNIMPGNYFAFFPSYVYMGSVYELFRLKYPEMRTLCQTKDMEEVEKEKFLENFKEQDVEPFVCFAVLGGMFSEGVDLPGKRLIGAFIISVGLPQLSFERLLISNHFGREGKGFEYAYMYPGMNKVLQAGGRVIRTETDKGIIILMDERFALNEYASLFRDSWSGHRIVRGKPALEAEVTSFWHKNGTN